MEELPPLNEIHDHEETVSILQCMVYSVLIDGLDPAVINAERVTHNQVD
jgi:hypothetical protein